ncbi:hypothetical protein M0802_004035 [Mischocyttarus mexicanus]|nr:hypothetical protein M0802_004035 [Mischocyttarus mexicanus]
MHGEVGLGGLERGRWVDDPVSTVPSRIALLPSKYEDDYEEDIIENDWGMCKKDDEDANVNANADADEDNNEEEEEEEMK